MAIGKFDSVDLAAPRPAPARLPDPASAAPRAARDTPVPLTGRPASPEAVAAAVNSANAYLRSVSTSIQFSFDQETGRTIVRMVDAETEEVLRQIPGEEMLAISKSIDRMQGLLVDRKV